MLELHKGDVLMKQSYVKQLRVILLVMLAALVGIQTVAA
jgi:hypothetical protein